MNLIAGLVTFALIAWVLRPVFTAACWAAILVYVCWPVYLHVRRLPQASGTLGALIMTGGLAALISGPLIGVAVLAEQELVVAYLQVGAGLDQAPLQVPEVLQAVPWLDRAVHDWSNRHTMQPGWLTGLLAESARRWASELADVLGGLGRNAVTLLFTLMTCFFLFRDGEVLTRQVVQVATHFLGVRIVPYLEAGRRMIRAVVFGVLVAALAQGFMAALGYWLLGVHAPVLLGCATALLSVVPLVGTAFVWGSVGLWLLATGAVWKGVAGLPAENPLG